MGNINTNSLHLGHHVKLLLVLVVHLFTIPEILGLKMDNVLSGRVATAMCSAVTAYQETGILQPLQDRKLSQGAEISFYRRGGGCEKRTETDKCFTFGIIEGRHGRHTYEGKGCHKCETWEFGEGDKLCAEMPWSTPQQGTECAHPAACMFTYFRDKGTGRGRGIKRECSADHPSIVNKCVDMGDRVVCRCNIREQDIWGRWDVHCNHCGSGTFTTSVWEPPTEEHNFLCNGIDLSYSRVPLSTTTTASRTTPRPPDDKGVGCHECEVWEFGSGDNRCVEAPWASPRQERECAHPATCMFTYFRDTGSGLGRGVKRECGVAHPAVQNGCMDMGDRVVCRCNVRDKDPEGKVDIHCNHCSKGTAPHLRWEPPSQWKNHLCEGIDLKYQYPPSTTAKTTTTTPRPPDDRGVGCHECEIWEHGGGDKKCVEEPWKSPRQKTECHYPATCMFTYFRDTGSGQGRGIKRECSTAYPELQNSCIDLGDRVVCRCNIREKDPWGKDVIHCNHCSKSTAYPARWDPPTESENHLCEGIDLKYRKPPPITTTTPWPTLPPKSLRLCSKKDMTLPQTSQLDFGIVEIRTYNKSLYALVREPMLPWTHAMYACATQGMQLVDVRNEFELNFLNQLLFDHVEEGKPGIEFWIGGHRFHGGVNELEAKWFVGDRKIQKNVWNDGEGYQNRQQLCTILENKKPPQFKVSDTECEGCLPFICKSLLGD